MMQRDQNSNCLSNGFANIPAWIVENHWVAQTVQYACGPFLNVTVIIGMCKVPLREGGG